jgi:hypothetical protein
MESQSTNIWTFPYGFNLTASGVEKLINHYLTKRKDNDSKEKRRTSVSTQEPA